jgi:hypothetical protein
MELIHMFTVSRVTETALFYMSSCRREDTHMQITFAKLICNSPVSVQLRESKLSCIKHLKYETFSSCLNMRELRMLIVKGYPA